MTSDDRVRALEAAIRALRERNEVLELDRELLGTRVGDLEKRVVMLKRELDKTAKQAAKQVKAAQAASVSPARKAARRLRRGVAKGRRAPSAEASPPAPSRSELQLRRPSDAARSRLRVVGVLDTMSAECFAESVDLILPTPTQIDQAFAENDVDLVLIESAWQGNGGTWQYKVGTYSKPESQTLPHVRRLVDAARRRGIPTVFWNKEDPVHFVKFAEAARLCDYIFTTDADRIGAYRALRGGVKLVDAFSFSAQPSLHNPIGGAERLSSPVFAGTFYQRRHVSRQGSLRMLLEAAAPFGLVIYDRQHGKGQDGYDFPNTVAGHVKGGLPYAELLAEYKRHKVFLNTNSVTASPTMFSRRVFELLACGTPVVSTPSRGMELIFGDLVDSVTSSEEATVAIKRLVEDQDHWLRRSRLGMREVLLHHTYAHRLQQIATTIGLGSLDAGPSVALVLSEHDDLRDAGRLLASARGVREVAVPRSVPAEAVDALVRTAQPGRVVTYEPDRGQGAATVVSSEWIVGTGGLGGDAEVLTDLAVATSYAPGDAVVVRPGTPYAESFREVSVTASDGVARRTAGVRQARPSDDALLVWAG